MGGGIDFKSTTGKGTTFFFSIQNRCISEKSVEESREINSQNNSKRSENDIPVEILQSEKISVMRSERKYPLLEFNNNSENILVVDDEFFCVFAMQQMLSSFRIKSDTVNFLS